LPWRLKKQRTRRVQKAGRSTSGQEAISIMSKNSGLSIRDMRNRLSMTQEEFAHALGITVSTVNRWENGHSEPSKLARATITRLAGNHGIFVESTPREQAGMR
jgi:DNA-binding transcriptional regulator YiaG